MYYDSHASLSYCSYGCSDEKNPLEQEGEKELRVENCFSRGVGTDVDGSLVKDFGMVLLDDAGDTYAGVPGPVPCDVR